MFSSIFNAKGHAHQAYEPLNPKPHDPENNGPQKRDKSATNTRLSITLVVCSFLQVILIFYALSLLKAFSTQALSANTSAQDYDPVHAARVSNCSCGATIQEARALDCTFDVLSLAWLPPSCIDAALTHEFATSGPGPDGAWDYWAHPNGTTPIALDEVAALAGRPDGTVYTSLGFHVLHCSFYWRKQWRLINGVGAALAMEARYARESHVEHCQKVFMMEGSREKGITEGLVRLGGAFF